VKIEWITPPYIFDVHTGNTAGTLANGYTVDIVVHRKGADYREPKGYFIGQSVPMRTAYVKDVKSSGTAGGTFTGGAWQTRDLNTVEGDSSFLSLSSNQFTLGAGTYEIEADAPARSVNDHQSALYDVTNTTYYYGTSETVSSTVGSQTRSFIKKRLVLSASTVFEIRHRCQTTASTNGFGESNGFGGDESYTQVKITKVK
jgi:hypothetical protein